MTPSSRSTSRTWAPGSSRLCLLRIPQDDLGAVAGRVAALAAGIAREAARLRDEQGLSLPEAVATATCSG